MKGIKTTGILISILISSCFTAFAESTDYVALENDIYNHMENRDTTFDFTYDQDSAIKLLQDASKKDDYLERSISLYKTIKTGDHYEAIIEYRTTKDQENYIDSELKRIVYNLIDSRMTDVEKVEAINDYLVKIYRYDDSYKSDNVYTALTTGKTICQGYAMTAYKMFKILGIDCRIETGVKDNLSHAWNLVKLNNKWYQLDITNNDNVVRDKYLLKSDQFMKDNGYTWNESDYPKADQNYFSEATEYLDYNNDQETDIKEYYNGGKWVSENGKTYFLRDSGYYAIGWFSQYGSWYYMNSDGVMQTGWVKIGSDWYYMNNDGKMLSSTTINGYKLGSNGAMIN